MENYVKKAVKENRLITANGMIRDLKLPIKRRDVCIRMKQMGYGYHRLRKRPWLTAVHIINRLKFARKNFQRCWLNVIFSDEVSIEVEQSWMPKGQQMELSRHKYPVKQMFWACIDAKGKSNIVPVNCTLNAAKYIELLKEHLDPYMKTSFYRLRMTFQQDNAPAHKAKKTILYFKNAGIKVLDWPANSPDLNPIENLWNILKQKVYNRNPKTKSELIAFTKEEWNNIEKKTLFSLVASVQNVYTKLSKNKVDLPTTN